MEWAIRKQKKNRDEAYLDAEKENLGHHHIQIVQVAAQSLDQLKRAYPNYDLDTSDFVSTLRTAIGR